MSDVVEVNPDTVVNPDVITLEPTADTRSQEEIIRSQMEAEGMGLDGNPEKLEIATGTIGENEQAITAVDQEIDQSMRVMESLEAIANVIARDSKKNKNTNTTVNNSVNALRKSVSLETINTTATMSLEGIAEVAKEVWAKIIELIKKSIEMVKNFFLNIFLSADKLKEEVKELRGRIPGASVSPKEDKFENEYLVRSLNIAGHFPVNIKTSLNNFKDAVHDTFNNSLSSNVKMGKLLNILFGEKRDTAYPIDSSFRIPKSEDNDRTIVAENNIPNDFSTTPPLKVVRSEELFGGKAIYNHIWNTDLNGKDGIQTLSKIRAAIRPFNSNTPETTDKEIPILSTGDLGTILTDIDAILSDVITYKSSLSQFTHVKNEMRIMSLGLLNQIHQGNHSEAIKDALRDNRTVIISAIRLMDQPAVDVGSYTIRTCNSLLKLVRETLKLYGSTSNNKTLDPSGKKSE
jgi:hypothetical protein